MKRRRFIQVAGLSAFAVSASGFSLIETDHSITTDCATSKDMLGPFFRKNAPYRSDLTYEGNDTELELIVVGQLFGADCQHPLPGVEIDVWHCDHRKKYDMDSAAFRCRGKMVTNKNGEYHFRTFVPPPYGGRPKHIHYLIDGVEGYQRLATQLYFKGDPKIKPNNWVKYPWDERRILEVYQNMEKMAEVRLDLFLNPSA